MAEAKLKKTGMPPRQDSCRDVRDVASSVIFDMEFNWLVVLVLLGVWGGDTAPPPMSGALPALMIGRDGQVRFLEP